MNKPFENAIDAHGPTVLRVCRAVLGMTPDADDAWSETFLAALRAWPDLPDDTNVEAWLVRVAQRKTVDVIRARSRQPVPVDELPTSIAGTDGIPHEADPDLWSAVASLPERQRLAVAYHYVGGLPHKETAALIGGTTEAVRRAAADGITRLRTTYGASAAQEGTR
ncbi:RNA polymerase sigma24 factor [Flexivirga endophytica]|uniref:RNA polymerase sigma24 factor n=1 Tax=Flexivirga endophytica TaxID=1849103 RepID=A0A916T2F2_9MICO|nr:sigma-70 family RNA polymerase sigma factor [Flexivirga endophytica]GGB28002.1 RNA polymerase sigma24 factor [Flexivirga endophytica]GHB61843.1 RNA polymerase sigma24 factor [Flexivirga endophytica]